MTKVISIVTSTKYKTMAFLNEVTLKILIVVTIVQTEITSLRIQFLSLRIHERRKAKATKDEISSKILILYFFMLIRVLLKN